MRGYIRVAVTATTKKAANKAAKSRPRPKLLQHQRSQPVDFVAHRRVHYAERIGDTVLPLARRNNIEARRQQ
jgi:hypothetical protein